MNSERKAWPNGMPAVGQTARRTRNVTARDIELFAMDNRAGNLRVDPKETTR